MAIADGACAARSRREEEDDALPSSTTTNEEIARNPGLPNGLRARVRTQTLSCADEHLRYIQFDLWTQQLSCYFGIDHLVTLDAPVSCILGFTSFRSAATLLKQVGRGCLASRLGNLQSGQARFVLCVHFGPFGQQDLDDWAVPIPNGVHEWRAATVVP